VAGVAHEINNPVNCIAGNLNHASNYIQDLLALLHLYRKHYPNPNFEILDLIKTIDLDFLLQDMPELMSSMKMGTERICQIVRSLQNFSRLEDTQMKAVNIHEGLDCTLLILKNRLKGMAGHSGIEVVKQYGELPLVECYAGQLNQVFMNILSNAIDALSDGNSKRSPQDIRNHPSQITIRTEVLRSNIVKISIADNGPGITEAVKARLFEPFFTTKPMGKGTGLGLSISYQIVVEKHKGLLWCESKPGKGTEFCIEIPICQSNELSPYRVIKQLEMCTSQA
jgi:signal transduction histidine kinase